ncbi:hypothetical protein OCL06_15980 [Alteromonas sp. ASW11-19]|uniref:DUF3426 domain-containing protein n=1 Tax=Alteromonas salexigens TaxID=2982530 RepID=A0ABT2VV48_9ALTE|nr:hypothetical protein [Alteromonas salexigens]MCU7556091.1 hypothetical protein [Alteromonas salexigens]
MENTQCEQCHSPDVSTTKTLLGFNVQRCQQCGYRKTARLSRKREGFYAFVFLFLSLAIFNHFSERFDAGLITVEDVISPFVIYLFLLATGVAIIKNRFFVRATSSAPAKPNTAPAPAQTASEQPEGVYQPRRETSQSRPKKAFSGRLTLILGVVGLSVLMVVLLPNFITPAENALVVKDASIDWNLNDNYSLPVEVTIYVQNTSDDSIAGEAVFALLIDNNKIGGHTFNYFKNSNFSFDTLIKEMGESAYGQALKNYVERRMRLPEGLPYEPIERGTASPEEIYFRAPIELKELGIKKIIRNVEIPVKSRFGYGTIKFVRLE